MTRSITPADVQEWARRYEAGETYRTIAQSTPWSEPIVARHIKRTGVKTRPLSESLRLGKKAAGLETLDRDIADLMRHDGLIHAEIAQILGFSLNHIHNTMRHRPHLPGRRITRAEHERAREAHRQGIPGHQIAASLGIKEERLARMLGWHERAPTPRQKFDQLPPVTPEERAMRKRTLEMIRRLDADRERRQEAARWR